tara:strand:- start:162 stop:368 length:207 start_codon:yes stop_codon:yes gene_type:complete
MNTITLAILILFGLSIMNVSLRILFDFFDIKRELYVEYLNWVNMIIIFVVILPTERGNLIKRLTATDI